MFRKCSNPIGGLDLIKTVYELLITPCIMCIGKYTRDGKTWYVLFINKLIHS